MQRKQETNNLKGLYPAGKYWSPGCPEDVPL